MLKTEGDTSRILKGINQQDFDEIQSVEGAYPNLAGLQQRIPGKTLTNQFNGPVGSIYAFYNVYGRNYTLKDFGSIEIEEVEVPIFISPVVPPLGNSWFDDFESYEDDLISKFWGGGAWASYVGVCETLIIGFIDPFLVYDSVIPVPIDTSRLPQYAGDIETADVPQNPWSNSGRFPNPSNCDSLPASFVPYTTVSIASVITDIETYAGSAPCTMGAVGSECILDEGAWQAPASVGGHPYDTLIGGSLSASEGRLSRTAFTGFSWQRRIRSDGSQTNASFSIENLSNVPRRARFFLVGTKSLSDGVTINSTVTTCATFEIFYGGQTRDEQTINVNNGIYYSDPIVPNTEIVQVASGSVSYTELRIYDFTSIYEQNPDEPLP